MEKGNDREFVSRDRSATFFGTLLAAVAGFILLTFVMEALGAGGLLIFATIVFVAAFVFVMNAAAPEDFPAPYRHTIVAGGIVGWYFGIGCFAELALVALYLPFALLGIFAGAVAIFLADWMAAKDI